jgi:PAS domain S-box-containing protein
MSIKRIIFQKLDRLYPPDQDRHRARMIYVSSLVMMLLSLINLAMLPISWLAPRVINVTSVDVTINIVFLLLGLSLTWLLYSGRRTLAGWLLISVILVVGAFRLYAEGSPTTDLTGAFSLIIAVLLGRILGGRRVGWIVFGLGAAIYVGMVLAWYGGRLPAPPLRSRVDQAGIALFLWLFWTAVLIVIVDATMRVLVRQADAVARSEADLLRAQRIAQVGNWEWHLEQGILRGSEEMCRIFGLEKQSLSYDRLLSTAHPQDVDALAEQVSAALRGDCPFRFDYRIVRPDGEVRWIHSDGEVIRAANGAPLCVYGAAQDITVRARAQEALQDYSDRLEEMVEARTAELEQAQRQLLRREKLALLGQLAGSVAHDLRNPLGTIRNATYLLHLAIEAPAPEVAEALRLLDRETEAATGIITHVLDAVRTGTPRRRPVDLAAVAERALAHLPPAAGLTVQRRFAPGLPLLHADPDQLERALNNLCLNAVQAMTSPGSEEAAGRLTVETAPSADGWVSIAISDTGIGIPEENLPQLFEPLFTTKAKGIGLGLALVKSVVDAHQGRIEVQSAGVPGQGSTFTLYLPVGTVPDAG